MADWFYKATNTRLDKDGTRILAERGFLCRSAYTGAEHWAANVRSVAFGDVIHFYFVDPGHKPIPFGAFEVIRREDFKSARPTPSAKDFAGPVPGCALYEVLDPAFIRAEDPTGAYQPDPKLGKYTGWLLRKVGPAAAAAPEFLRNRRTLVRG